MGLFSKIFKSDSEGLIESYLQTYKNIKNSPQFQAAALLFENETKVPNVVHYVMTTIKYRRYKQHELDWVMELFGRFVNDYIKKSSSLSEEQLIIAMLKAAHFVEAGHNANPAFEGIANKYVHQYFPTNELASHLDITNLTKIYNIKY